MAEPPSRTDDFTERNKRFFRILAVVLGVGVVFSFLYGLGYLPGAGLFRLEAAARSALLAIVVVAVVLGIFLLRIGVIFDVEKKVDQMFDLERNRLAEARKRELEEARAFRDEMRRELSAMRDQLRNDFNAFDQRVRDAVNAANQAMKMAQEAMARADALSKEPAYRSTIEQLLKDVASMMKDLAALRNADKVNSPLLADLRDRVVALEAGQKKLNVRVDETMESVERRDMEQAALRQTLDSEVANLRKRESLLLVKQKEIEDYALSQASKAAKPMVTLRAGEEAEHIMAIEPIGKVFASRLNAQGIITVPQLLAVDAGNIATQIDASPDQVAEWQAMGKLMRLPGVGAQSAEILVKAGIRTPQQLASEDAAALATRVRESQKVRKGIQGVDVTPQVAKRWIDAAKTAK